MPDTFLFANNATAALAASISAAATTLTVASGKGALFPSPVAGQVFTVTVEDALAGLREIMYCTARAGDVLTVQRAKEGTVAAAFTAGATAVVQNRLTKGALEAFAQGNLGGLVVRGASWVSPLGSAIAVPVNDVFIRCPRNGVITKASLGTQGGPGSCSVDIRKSTHAAFPPATSICNAGQPFIVGDIKYESTDFTVWSTTAVNEGDWLGFHLVTASVFTGIFVNLFIQES